MFPFSGCWNAVSTVPFDASAARDRALAAPIPHRKELNMQSTRRLRTAAFAALSVLPVAGFAASGNTFMNGQSIYGQPAAQGAPVRVVDLASTDRLNVAYGESVTFRSGAKQFSWTFDGLDRRAVDVNQIAPAGFVGKPVVVYVGRNPSNRR